jgi:hypothetical protein
MNTFNLTQAVDFPARINNSVTLIDTIFVDIMIYDKIKVKPFINGFHQTTMPELFIYSMLTLDFSSVSLRKN